MATSTKLTDGPELEIDATAKKAAVITKVQKAAVLLVAIGKEASAEILKNLSQPEVQKLVEEIARLKNIPPELEKEVLEEYSKKLMEQSPITKGGLDYAKDVLEKALGKDKAKDVISQLNDDEKETGFSVLQRVDSQTLLSFIQNEHPQTIAFILTQLPREQAAEILALLPLELQPEVSLRIATMDKIMPEVVKEMENTLESQYKPTVKKGLSQSGGPKTIAEILNSMSSQAEKNILQSLEGQNQELATQIKNLMFVFEDLLLIDDRGMQRVLKEVETKDIAIALKAASEEVKTKVFSNVSERVAETIKEEMEFLGPMRLSDVEANQQKIANIARVLEEQGQIIIAGKGKKEELVV
jgi:flagellar motor switch protein FliG